MTNILKKMVIIISIMVMMLSTVAFGEISQKRSVDLSDNLTQSAFSKTLPVRGYNLLSDEDIASCYSVIAFGDEDIASCYSIVLYSDEDIASCY